MAYGARLSLYQGNGRRKYINAEERLRFLEVVAKAAPKRRTFCLTLLHTGCRVSEALLLTPQSIQSATGVLAFPCLKKRERFKVREIPVPSAFMVQLSHTHIEGTSPSIDDCRPLWGWSRTKAWRVVKILMAEAHISGAQACPKGLRHGFGVHAIRSGVPLNLLQKWLGHERMETTAIYADACGPEERAIARKMWQ